MEESSAPTVKGNVVPYPEEPSSPVKIKQEVVDLTDSPPPHVPELPPIPCDFPFPQDCCPVQGGEMVRDLALSLLAAFVLGAGVASLFSLYSRRSSRCDA